MTLLEPFQYAFFWQALLAGALVLVSAALASFTVLSNNQSFFTQGISQSMVLGVAAGAGSVAGGLVSAIICAALASLAIHGLRRISWLPQDAAIAIVSSTFFALGIIAINSGDRSVSVTNVLFGNILGVTGAEVAVLGLLAVASIAFFGLFGNKLQFIAQNAPAAQAAGLPVRVLELARILMLALLAAIAIPVVGVLLVVAAAVLPGVIGMTWTTHYRWALPIAVGVSGFAVLGGLLVSYFANFPTGPSIVLVLTGAWLIALLRMAALSAVRSRQTTPQT